MRPSYACFVCWVAPFVACGGNTRDPSPSRAGDAAALPEAGRGGFEHVAGAPSTPPDGPAETGGAAGQSAEQLGGENAGAACAKSAPLKPASGLRFCEVPMECAGLECRARGARPEHVCASPCPTRNECPAEELCVQGSGLEPICLLRCDWPTDCAYRFDCFDWYDDGQYVCVPAAWLYAEP